MRQNFSQLRWAKLNPLPAFNGFSEAQSSSTNVSTNGKGWVKMAAHQQIQSSGKANCTFQPISRGKTH
jgi:hypothetical protein